MNKFITLFFFFILIASCSTQKIALGSFELYDIYRESDELGKIYYRINDKSHFVTKIDIPKKSIDSGAALIEDFKITKSFSLNNVLNLLEIGTNDASFTKKKSINISFKEAELRSVGILDISTLVESKIGEINSKLRQITNLKDAKFYVINESIRSSKIEFNVASLLEGSSDTDISLIEKKVDNKNNIEFDKELYRNISYNGDKKLYFASSVIPLKMETRFDGNLGLKVSQEEAVVKINNQ